MFIHGKQLPGSPASRKIRVITKQTAQLPLQFERREAEAANLVRMRIWTLNFDT